MDYIYLSRRRKSIILILTLLVHALFLLFLLAALASDQAWYNPRHLFEHAQVLPQSPQTDPAASVIFQDAPSLDTPGSTKSYAGHSGRADNEEPEPQPEAPAMPGPSAEQTMQALQEALQQTKLESSLLQQDQEQASQPAHALDEAPQEQAIPERALPQMPDAHTPRQAVDKKYKSGRANQGTAHGLSIGDITRGFLKSLEQEHGRTPQTTDAETMARQRYSTRVWSLLKQSYRAHRSPTYLLSDLTTEAVLVVQLNKEGKLIKIELQHPNKTHDLYEVEQIIINAAKKAGLYPPIPPAFNTDTITLSYPLAISVREGVHTYDFVYQ